MQLKNIPEIITFKKINLHKKCEFIEYHVEKVRRLFDKIVKNSDLELYAMKYKSDSLKIFGYIFKHKNAKINTPVVIHCRGGNNHPTHSIGELTIGSFYNHTLFELVKENKIIIFASTYRGDRLSEGVDDFGGNDVNDIVNLYPIIKKYKYTDENRIGLFGWSRGVMMSLLVHKNVNWVKCLILGAGFAELSTNKEFRPKFYKMLTGKEGFNLTEEDLQKRSAINWISELSDKVPILILHGTSDSAVSVKNAYIFEDQFKKHNISHKIVIYDKGTHGLFEYFNEIKKESIDWIEKYILK